MMYAVNLLAIIFVGGAELLSFKYIIHLFIYLYIFFSFETISHFLPSNIPPNLLSINPIIVYPCDIQLRSSNGVVEDLAKEGREEGGAESAPGVV
ncbi:expressed protein [Phakopsora pachyrhizi]|uniref:Expressed protein n=1 Tax=Phakopsora pachyrhizi TaxID=170000 RepID=A0AAV0AG21_PHAPC|nr:expressed protein [Phakopsora pachyrhizi]